jgi:hypothetical protein
MMLLVLETGMKFEELSDLQVNSFDLSNAYAPGLSTRAKRSRRTGS